MGVGGRGRGHRGVPPPPFAKASGRGGRKDRNSICRRGKRHVKSTPTPTPFPRGWAIEERSGLELQRRGPSLAPPPTGLGRARSVTLSLSEELCCFLCSTSGCGGAGVSPGGRRNDVSDRHSSPGGECGTWVPAPGLGDWEGPRSPGCRHNHREEDSGQHLITKPQRDFCSRGQRLSPPGCS